MNASRARIIRNSAGEIELVLEISVDITEIRQLQEALTASRQDYRHLFDEVPCYISIQDQDLNIIRNKGRQAFLEEQPGNFSRLIHDYSDEGKGFI